MTITAEGIVFTSGERVVLAMACTCGGLRKMAYQKGFWSKKRLIGIPDTFAATAERLLLRFGDLKLAPKKISKICGWSMEEIESEVFPLT